MILSKSKRLNKKLKLIDERVEKGSKGWKVIKRRVRQIVNKYPDLFYHPEQAGLWLGEETEP